MGKLFALFTLIPIMEIYLLFVVGNAMGFWPTVALIVLTAALGAVLGKREGLKVWRAWREAIAEGRIPEEGVLGGVLVLIGGVLLITPGVVSDLAGIALLIPPSRRVIAKLVRKHLEARFAQGAGPHIQFRVAMGNADVLRDLHGFARGASHGEVIDTEGEVVAERRRGDPKAYLQG